MTQLSNKLLTKTGSDHFQTPPHALKPLYPYLKKDWIIWEPACGKGNLVRDLRQNNVKVMGSDKYIIPNNDFDNCWYLDFLTNILNENFDCIITNPPFSCKNQFIERCYKLGKPFALLLPLTALETKRRQTQWKQGLELILFSKRINFETPNNVKSSAWFPTAWFTYGLNIGKQITFYEI